MDRYNEQHICANWVGVQKVLGKALGWEGILEIRRLGQGNSQVLAHILGCFIIKHKGCHETKDTKITRCRRGRILSLLLKTGTDLYTNVSWCKIPPTP
jgi:hypothetical protein